MGYRLPKMKIQRGFLPWVLSSLLNQLTPMLSRVTVSNGLEVCSLKSSRLDDWFLGAGPDSQPRSASVPFFPDVHKEVAKSWTANFMVRNNSSPSSLPSMARWLGGTLTFPRWRELLRSTCAQQTPPLLEIILISLPKHASCRWLSLRARPPLPFMPWRSCRSTKPKH